VIVGKTANYCRTARQLQESHNLYSSPNIIRKDLILSRCMNVIKLTLKMETLAFDSTLARLIARENFVTNIIRKINSRTIRCRACNTHVRYEK
jgi:hypothetical protein